MGEGKAALPPCPSECPSECRTNNPAVRLSYEPALCRGGRKAAHRFFPAISSSIESLEVVGQTCCAASHRGGLTTSRSGWKQP